MTFAKVHILYDKWTDRGVWSGGNWRPTLPLANLATDDIGEPARSVSADPADAWWRIDLGQSLPIRMVWLGDTNLTDDARIRMALGDDPAGGPFTLDTGFAITVEPTVPEGTRPWGVMPWGGIEGRRDALWIDMQAGGAGRYLWLWIDDAANPDGYVQLGRFVGGCPTVPRHNVSYGSSVTPRAARTGGGKRTRGGRKLKTGDPRPREQKLVFQHQTEDDALGAHYDILAQGEDNTMVLVLKPKARPGLRARLTMYCSLVSTTDIVESSHRRYSWTMHVDEEI